LTMSIIQNGCTHSWDISARCSLRINTPSRQSKRKPDSVNP
jgi:hypothetical protein